MRACGIGAILGLSLLPLPTGSGQEGGRRGPFPKEGAPVSKNRVDEIRSKIPALQDEKTPARIREDAGRAVWERASRKTASGSTASFRRTADPRARRRLTRSRTCPPAETSR